MTKMTRDAAARIQSSACRNNNGVTPKNSFAARATSAAYKNEPVEFSTEISSSNLLCKIGLFAVTAAVTAASLGAAGYYAYQHLSSNNDN